MNIFMNLMMNSWTSTINREIDICGKTFKSTYYIRDHILKKHKEQRIFTCFTSPCEKSFSKLNEYISHKNKVHSQLICEICDKKFPYIREFKHHIHMVHKQYKEAENISHSNPEIYKSTICDFNLFLVFQFTLVTLILFTDEREKDANCMRWSFLLDVLCNQY